MPDAWLNFVGVREKVVERVMLNPCLLALVSRPRITLGHLDQLSYCESEKAQNTDLS
jgi:hypothetical protein